MSTLSGNIGLRIPTDLYAGSPESPKRWAFLLTPSWSPFLQKVLHDEAALAKALQRKSLRLLPKQSWIPLNMPTRGGELLKRLDAKVPEWRAWIPPKRLADD